MSQVRLDGNPNQQDSFVACIHGVLKSWGRKVSYAKVGALSGTIFSPIYDEQEDCRAWWMEGGNDIRIEFLGQALGFDVEVIKREWSQEDVAWNANPNQTRVPNHTSRYFEQIKKAVQSGKTILVDTWPVWSVLAGWNKNASKIPFTTFSAFTSLVNRAWPPYKTGKAYAISATKPSLSRKNANRETLDFAAKVATGSLVTERFRYGGVFYSAVAKRLTHQPFCVPCGNDAYRCGLRTVNRVVGGVEATIAYLDTLELDQIKNHYKGIYNILVKFQDSKLLMDSWQDRSFRFEMRDAFREAYRIHGEVAKEFEILAQS